MVLPLHPTRMNPRSLPPQFASSVTLARMLREMLSTILPFQIPNGMIERITVQMMNLLVPETRSVYGPADKLLLTHSLRTSRPMNQRPPPSRPSPIHRTQSISGTKIPQSPPRLPVRKKDRMISSPNKLLWRDVFFTLPRPLSRRILRKHHPNHGGGLLGQNNSRSSPNHNSPIRPRINPGALSHQIPDRDPFWKPTQIAWTINQRLSH